MHGFLLPSQAFLRYVDLPGADPACIYLHGLGLSSLATYARVVAEPGLSQRRSILVDFLGCGFSDRPASFGYALEDHAQTVAALLDHLGLQQCAVIGHSFGGAVAITLAALRPDLVGRLVLAEALLDPGGGETSRRIAGQSEEEFCASGYRSLLAEVHADALTGDPLSIVVAGAFNAVAPFALYRCAVGLVRGTQPTMRRRLLDLTIPRAYFFGHASLPNPDTEVLPASGITVKVLPGAGHGMMWDDPRGFAAALSQTLDS
ncbi:MAG TPA: alpha/beta hydrolase [Herpetosiphonaceae bacterium]